MDRILQNTAATLSVTFRDVASATADPGTVNVTVLADDGSTVTTGTATGTGVGPRTFPLTPAQTALLDQLTVRWASTTLGTLTTIVEVVGGFLFDLSELTGGDAAALAAARVEAEEALEAACNVAFVPRYSRETLSGDGTPTIRLRHTNPRRVRWATAGGVALTATDLAALATERTGFLHGYSWPVGHGNVTVGLEHGLDFPPRPVSAAARDLARYYLAGDGGGVDPRAERVITEDGTLIFGAGATGLPSVDRIVDHYRLPAVA